MAIRETPPIAVPLTDLGTGTYHGFEGGLYPGGSNDVPADHAAIGLVARDGVQPLDVDGNPAATGKVVLLSIGMSTTTQIFCHADWGRASCNSWSFTGQALADPAVNHSSLVIFNGARAAQTSTYWDSPNDPNYARVDSMLTARGLSSRQLQVAWVLLVGLPKNGTRDPTLPDPNANAYKLETDLGIIVRLMRSRWPNLKQVFFSSYPYGGYDTTKVVEEPYAYESGFTIKWLIDAQIEQERTGVIDSRAGDLSGLWLAWGPYLWDETAPRTDYESDGKHPSNAGEAKLGGILLDFFKASPFTQQWFLVP